MSTLKIDKSFISNLKNNSDEETIIKSIINNLDNGINNNNNNNSKSTILPEPDLSEVEQKTPIKIKNR